MTFLKKHKTLLIGIITVFLMFFTLGSIIYTTESKKENVYKLTPNGTVLISEIWINGSKQKIETFAADNGLTMVDHNVLLNKEVDFILPSIYEFNILFYSDSTSGNININTNGIDNIISLNTLEESNYLYQGNDDSNRSILKNYINNDFKITHLLIVLLSGIVYFFAIKFIINFIKKIKEDKVDIKDVLLYFVSSFIIAISTIYILLEVIGKYSMILYTIPLLLGLYFIKDGIKSKLHYLFIYLMIPLGLLFTLSMPIENVPDENSHFYKSYIISNKLLVNDIDKDNDYCISDNKSVNSVLSEYNYDVLNMSYTLKARSFYANYLKQDNNTVSNGMNCYKNVSKLPFVGYTITTISLLFSKLLGMPVLLSYILGRVSNLLFYILICYYSIKSIPKYKKSLFLVSTLPIAIQCAGGFNQDCVHNALAILLFTKMIEAINSSNRITKKEIITIVVLSVLLGLCKLGYFPIILLCLLIPLKRFKNKKQSIIDKLIMILPIILSFVILYFAFWSVGGGESTISAPVYSIYSFFKDPIDFIRLYLSTTFKTGFYMFVQGMTDGFAWSTKYNSDKITYFIVAAYSLLVLSGVKEEKSDKKYIITSLLISIFIILLIYTSMLGGNLVGASYINGLQPRYFIIPLLLILTTLNTKLIDIKVDNKEFIYGILIVMIYLGVITTLMQGFYV